MESKNLVGKYVEMYSEEDVDFVVDMFDLDVDEIKMRNLKKYVGNRYAYVHFFENEGGYLDFAYGSEFSRDSLNGSEEIKVNLPSKKSDDAVEVLDLTKPIAEQLAGKHVICRSEEEVDRLIELSGMRKKHSEFRESMVSYAEKNFLYVSFEDDFVDDGRSFHYGSEDVFKKYCEGKEIKIPLPSIESRILAEKVLSDGSVVIDVDLYRTKSMGSGDMVKKPSHYQLLPEYEVKDINKALLDKIQASDFDMSLYEAGWYQQAMQYFMRFYAKNGLEDLEKGIETMQFAVDSLKKRVEEAKRIQDIAKHDIVYK